MIKKTSLLLFFASFLCSIHPLRAQSSDAQAIDFSSERLQSIFNILKTKSNEASPSCIEALKKLHQARVDSKNPSSSNDIQLDINTKILRALYTNAMELCEVDAQEVCNHQVQRAIKKDCHKLFSDKN